jgi:hypothetical protein
MMKILNDKMGRMVFILVLIGCAYPMISFASPTAAEKSIFDLMYYRDVLQVELETDVENLKNNRRFDGYQAASLTFKDANNEARHWDLKVRIRGNFRRLNCSEMPPLKLNFKKSSLAEAGLAKFDDLKLVTHCIEDRQAAYDLLLREYLAYKMYNELTDNSFRVQLLRITYKDSNTGKKMKQWGFVIEDSAQFKARTNSINCESCINAGLHAFDADNAKLVGIYQYLIGNSDWDIHIGRNVKFYKQDGKVIAVPYDFDFSGLVNAPYAVANPNYEIKFVRDRIYLGFEQLLGQMHSTLFYIEGKRKNLLSVVNRFRQLPLDSRTDMIDYLVSYLNRLEDIQVAKRLPITRINTVSP